MLQDPAVNDARHVHHDLETIEATRFGRLNFPAEPFDQILVDDAVRRCEEGKDVRDEVPFIVIKAILPVMEVLREVHLLGSPEAGFCLLVHLPYLFWQRATIMLTQ
jgi:hypothetical protein